MYKLKSIAISKSMIEPKVSSTNETTIEIALGVTLSILNVDRAFR